jgi:SAM-dependent methyltransferase
MNRFETGVEECGCCGGHAFRTWKTKPATEWAAVQRFCLASGNESSDYLGLPDHFTLVTCDVCGVVLTNPRLRDSIVQTFYDDYLSGRFNGYLPPYDEVFRYELLRPYVELVKEDTEGRPGSLLDVGCATGALLRHFRNLGWQTTGIEVSAYAANRARRFGDVHCGDVVDTLGGLAADAYEVVTFIDTLEHLASPRRSLTEACRVLRPKGLLLIEVPNVRAGLDEMSRHFHLFSAESLSRLLAATGFTAIREVSLEQRYNPSDPAMPGRFLHMTAHKPGVLQAG